MRGRGGRGMRGGGGRYGPQMQQYGPMQYKRDGNGMGGASGPGKMGAGPMGAGAHMQQAPGGAQMPMMQADPQAQMMQAAMAAQWGMMPAMTPQMWRPVQMGYAMPGPYGQVRGRQAVEEGGALLYVDGVTCWSRCGRELVRAKRRGVEWG